MASKEQVEICAIFRSGAKHESGENSYFPFISAIFQSAAYQPYRSPLHAMIVLCLYFYLFLLHLHHHPQGKEADISNEKFPKFFLSLQPRVLGQGADISDINIFYFSYHLGPFWVLLEQKKILKNFRNTMFCQKHVFVFLINN